MAAAAPGRGALILGLDTSAAHCAAALLNGDGQVLAARLEPMARGQAERLLPLLEEVLAAGCSGWGRLAALAVGTGPGNFTGTRIAVAAARGLALGLRIPALGVSAFEAVRAGAGTAAAAADLVLLAAPRDMAYVQAFREGRPCGAPRLIDPLAPPADLLAPGGARLCGHRAQEVAARLVAAGIPAEAVPGPVAGNPAEVIGRVALARLAAGAVAGRPAPVYVRPADAAPSADVPPVILA